MKNQKTTWILIVELISITVIFLLFTQKQALAQTVMINTTNTPTPQSITEIQIDQKNNEVDVLKSQLEVMSEYTDRLMNTVQWTIGTTIAILIVIIGANWYTTSRQYKSDLETFKTKTLSEITNSSDEIKVQLEKKLDNQFASLKGEIESIVKDQNIRINREVNELQINQLKAEAKSWEEKGVWGNALTCYTEIITLEPNHALITTFLLGLEKAITKCKDNLHAFDYEKIEEAMNKLDDSLNTKTVTTRIRELLKNITPSDQ